ncbi:LacI family DNA-binding transcriptional regulator [Paenibacillus sp. RC67]|uniref:LacI family DNA-binding transcriptional regulator n=1 Tax=Paenibacillus sp. RC67 TaxID=3039392 RepID=UPI0024AE2B7C|nr:LacI family DNA-binding transcriptional regulator [Paenibacillus sp. RC67]
MNITIKDVAKEANVSIGTVSRVLNGKDRVSKATRAKVEAAIAKLNFKPDRIARTMVRKQTQSIGLIVPVLSNEYWAALSEQVQEAAWDKGYTLLLCTAGYDLDPHMNCMATLAERKVDGIIAGIRIYEPKELRKLQKIDLPDIAIVSIGGHKLPNADYIGIDHFNSSAKAVEHLIRLGHTRIAYIGQSPSDREWGYRHALGSSGITVDNTLVVRSQHCSFAFGAEAVNHLLEEGRHFTAIFCWNDMTALGAIQSLELAGLSIPRDVAVIGYDDIPMAALVKPALTTVRQPLKDIGKTAVSLLISRIEDKEDGGNRSVVFSTEFIVRDSCGGKIGCLS